MVITSSWTRGKAAAYDACTGENLWTVTLSHVQQIGRTRYLGEVQLGFGTDDKGLQIRDPLTGAHLTTIPGVRNFFESPFSGASVRVARRKQLLVCSEGKGLISKVPLISFAANSAAFNPDGRVLVSEAAGPIRCFDLMGKELWRIQPPTGQHAIELSWSSDLQQWLGLMLQYDGATRRILVTVDEERIVELVELGIEDFKFSPNARILFGTDRKVRSIPSGEVVWNFD